MNNISFSLLFISTLLLFASCEKKDDDVSIFASEKSGEQYVSENNSFGLNVFKKFNSLSTDDNKLISPFNISMAMGMTYNGADNNTAKQIKKVLGWENLSTDVINRYNKELLLNFDKNSKEIQLGIQNVIWYSDKIDVKEAFLQKNKSVYRAKACKVNFSDKSAIERINKHNKDIVNDISPKDMMYIINSTYFHGKWKHRFNVKNTSIAEFFTSDNEKRNVEMMYQKADFNYYKSDTFQFVEMPYENENYAMFIMLPDSNNDINDIISELDYSTWNEYKNNLKMKRNINFGLPKFKFQQQASLIKLLSSMGIENLFIPEKSDLSNISDKKISINQMRHNATIEVDERGTKASAASLLASTFTALVDDNPFNLFVNRPFFFTIEEKSSNTILFIGKIEKP